MTRPIHWLHSTAHDCETLQVKPPINPQDRRNFGLVGCHARISLLDPSPSQLKRGGKGDDLRVANGPPPTAKAALGAVAAVVKSSRSVTVRCRGSSSFTLGLPHGHALGRRRMTRGAEGAMGAAQR